MQGILQRFYYCPKTFDVFNKKQICDSVIVGKENASKDWNCVTV